MQIASWLSLIFPVCMLIAMYSDLSKFQISNNLCLILAFSFIPVAILADLSLLQVAGRYGVALILFFVGMLLFHIKVFGGGDGKFIAAASVWTGYVLLPAFLLYIGIFGGLLALVVVLLRKTSLPDRVVPTSFWAPILSRDQGIPYGIAIGLAGIFLYPFLPGIKSLF